MSFWNWVEKAQEQAKEFADLVEEKASVIIQQAQDLRQNYDLQVASDILMHGMGATSAGNPAEKSDSNDTKTGAASSNRQLDIHYITENIMTMSFPYDVNTRPRGQKMWNDVNLVASYLKEKHRGHFMIWNVSEDPYDYSLFENQVLEYKFPGHPSPPLGLLFKICAAIESWLDADKSNVAVVHCLTGKGRTGSILACVLAWIGEFPSPLEALQYVADRRSLSIEELTIPSQRRYIQYFSNVLDGVKPRSEPLLLRRVIMNTIPNFSGGSSRGDGCCPYIQIFKNGTLVANSYLPSKASRAADSTAADSKSAELKWIARSEGSVSFHMDVVIHGDVLIRCRHIDPVGGKRESMFRAAFHTGYTPVGVLRLTKAQLDGCDADDRFEDDFFVDFIFAPVEKRDASGRAMPLNGLSTGPSATEEGTDSALAGAAKSVAGTEAAASDSGLVLESEVASKFDEMLHRDGRFWDKIAMRKSRAMSGDLRKKKSRKLAKSAPEIFSIGDSLESEPKSSSGDATLSSGPAATSAVIKKPNEMSDMELILQLAQAEEEDFNSVSASARSKDVATGIAEHPTAGSSRVDNPAESELQALENFERELGLIVSPPKAPAAEVYREPKDTSTAGEVPASNLSPDFEDNLDELEKYLQSLGST
jgi:protein-tyrosine phosphatase